MKKYFYRTLVFAMLCVISVQFSSAQTKLLNKMKEKVEDKIIDEVFGPEENNNNSSSPSNNQNNSGSSSSGSEIQNTKGGGLDNAGIDVEETLNNATASLNSKSYSSARYNIRQAMMAVELEIGKDVLKSFPEEVDGLPYQSDEDEVTSTGIGFIGLAIQRVYRKNDKQLEIIVANNSAWISAANMYLANPAYASSTDEYKTITFQGYRGIIEFDEYSGYKLSVPFGQSSIFVLEGVNFNNEQEVMSAANEFSIDKIKSKLGEQ